MNEIFIYGRHFAGPFLEVLDLLGTFVFARSGAAAGVKSKLDLFGLMVPAFATGNAGGITRDLLIGVVPPAAIRDWRYLGVCLLAGLVTFLWYPHIDMQRSAYTRAVVCDERVINKYRVHPALQSSEYMQRALPFRTRFGTLCSLWLAKSDFFGNGALIRNGETSGS